MSLADVTSARSSPAPEACPECDATASVTSDLHKYQVACTCKPSSVQYACADDPGPPPPAKTDTPPALPPRPPTNVLANTIRRNNAAPSCAEGTCRRRKYAWWCVACGALCAALGGLLAAQHILLRAYTASPHHLETVPAAVPAAMLVLTGVCIMSLARRRNRYSYMIKVVGACCLVCALTCVLVTITTTVIHMNKLQTLKFCEYTIKTRTCTCFSMAADAQHTGDDEGIRCAFEEVSDCGVVHGALYWCLRGVFALAVSAVLVCIFSCMLAYQLLSHERKKMYWEQLELRCRSLYRPPAGQQSQATAGRAVQNGCNCCSQCHPSQPAWDISLQHRFWAPGRIGNLYSPNPGAGRKSSAWSWFPWPRTNSQNSRCRMGGIPQSGDSAYGFCDTDSGPTPQQYDERSYPPNFQRPNQAILPQNANFVQNPSNFAQNPSNFGQTPANFGQNPSNFGQNPANFGQTPANFGQSSGFVQSGFSQEGFGATSGSFDAQTGVWGPPPPYSPQGRSGSRHHLHHQDPATATLLHHHHIDVHRQSLHDSQPHSCNRNSYLLHNMPQNIDINRINPDLARLNPDLRYNPDMCLNPDIARLNPEIARLNPDIARLNPDIARLNPDIARLNPEFAQMQMYPADVNEIGTVHLNEGRFNTLRGHLVPYRNCQRNLGLSAGNIHRDCRDDVTIECLHQKSASKVSDQSSDSCPKLGKENLGFQTEQHSPMRGSTAEVCVGGRGAGVAGGESEVYFADVSSCCNVSLKADCCMNPSVSALVGTIENHPESTSESEGSFTLTRQQRPQPQVGSKRRPRNDKIKNTDKMRQDINNSMRLTEKQIEQLNNSVRMNERMVERLNESSRLNDSRLSERMNDTRLSMNESRISDRVNDSRISDRMNETRLSDRLNESRLSERMNETRLSDRNECRISDRMNDSRLSERMNETRLSDRNECRLADRMHDLRLSERMIEPRHCVLNDRCSDSRDRLNESRMEDRRHSELNSSIRLEGSPKMRHLPFLSKNIPEHLRQSSSDSNKAEFFVPPPPAISPLSPKTEESLLSDDEQRSDQVYSNEPETSKCLGPDSQYEPIRDEKEVLKTNHHHCYSDTNTMDSGWQSGSEKQVTD